MFPKTKAFIDGSHANKALAELKDHFSKTEGGLQVSDVTDGKFQYVDLVQQGGGVWGIALAGYTYVLEQMGIRFFSVAGTSAGAINAMLIASMGNKEDEKSSKMLEELLNKNLFEFVDGKKDNWAFTKLIKAGIQKVVVKKNFGRNFLRAVYWTIALLLVLCILSFVANLFPSSIAHYSKYVGGFAGSLLLIIIAISVYAYNQFKSFTKTGYGLNEGNDFHNWLKGIIAKQHIQVDANKATIQTLVDFEEHFMRVPPGLTVKPDARRPQPEQAPTIPQLSIIASDITAERKIEFPRMWDLYWPTMAAIHPADFVRASMSIPIFFQTFPIHHVAGSLDTWKKHLDWQNDIVPSKAQFVDGGALSNFPISVFANPRYPVPRMPTFGIRLMDKKPDQTKNVRSTFAGYAGSIIGTMRANYDRDFTTKNRAFNLGVSNVQLNNHNWLNFFMDDKEKTDIFNCGVNEAMVFLKSFDWEEYKAARKRDADELQTPEWNPNNFR